MYVCVAPATAASAASLAAFVCWANAAAVAEFGMILRDSKFRGTASYAGVIETARTNLGTDPDGLRAEFVSLVQKAATLER